MPELYIYGPIGKGFDPFTGEPAISSRDVISSLKNLGGQDFDLRINSDGGDVFEAQAMIEAFAGYSGKITAVVDAVAASAASFITATAAEVLMAPGAMMMIHAPWTIAMGNEQDLRKKADLLQAVREGTVTTAYMERGFKGSSEELAQLLMEETWLNAQEAISLGLADGLSREERSPVAALVRPELFSKVPEQLLQEPSAELRNVPRDLRQTLNRVKLSQLSAKLKHGRQAREKDLTIDPTSG